MKTNRPIIIVGAGGVGSYLLPPLLRTVRDHRHPGRSPIIHLFDGDVLEDRNMDRQLFDHGDVGRNKAEALAVKYSEYYPNIVTHSEFFTGQEQDDSFAGAIVFCCADNHPARARALTFCDVNDGLALVCGNGYTDAEAMFYCPEHRGTKLDPRVMFPEITTSLGGDPLSPESCQGDAQEREPQLAIANMLAAAYALHLMWFALVERRKLSGEALGFAPVRHASNFSRITTQKVKDL